MGLFSNRVDRGSLKAGDHIYSWRTAYIYTHHGIYVGDNKVVHFTRRAQEVGTGSVLDILLVSSGPVRSQIPCSSCTHSEPNHGVVASCLDCFLAGGVLYRFEYSVTPAVYLARPRGGTCTLAPSDPHVVVVHRANHLLDNGFGCYNVFKNNCEDFAIYCKTGLLVLDQAGSVDGGPLVAALWTSVWQLTTNVRSGQAGSVVSGSLVAGLSTSLQTSLRLLTTNVRSGQVGSVVGRPLVTALSTSLRLLTTNVYGVAVTTVGVYCASRYAADIGMRKDVVKVSVEEVTRRLATDLVVEGEPRVLGLMVNNNGAI